MNRTLLPSLLLALAVGSVYAKQPALQKPIMEVGKPAPSFQAKTMDGKQIQFPSDYKGKIVLVNFWATWCHPCVSEQPLLASLYKKYPRDRFEILAVTLDHADMEERINAVMDQKGMTWPQIYEGSFVKGAVVAKFLGTGGIGIPQSFLIDGDTGITLACNPPKEKLDETIKAALEKKSGKINRVAAYVFPEGKPDDSTLMVNGAKVNLTRISATSHEFITAEIWLAIDPHHGLMVEFPLANGTYPFDALISPTNGQLTLEYKSSKGDEDVYAETWDSDSKHYMRTAEGAKPSTGHGTVRFTQVKSETSNIELMINGDFEGTVRSKNDKGVVEAFKIQGTLKDIPFIVPSSYWHPAEPKK